MRYGGPTCSTLDPGQIWSQMPLTGNWPGRGGLPVKGEGEWSLPAAADRKV